jgi:predicted ATPase
VRDHELLDALAQLIGAELIFRRGEPPDGSYAFKHMLVQDTAYQSLLRSRRQQLHGRIAAAIEERFAEIAVAEPELLAHHFSQAGLIEKAIDHWRQAGELAVRRSAMVEALGHFRHGSKELDRMPEGSERGVRELELQTAIGRVLIAVKGFSAPETGQAYDRARDLSGQVDANGRLFPVLYGQWIYRYARAELREAQALADQMLRLARQQEDPTLRLVGHRVLGSALFCLGAPHSAQAHLEQALALYDPTQHRALAFHYTADLRVTILSFLSLALFQLGYPDQSLARSREALAEAQELRHPLSLAFALQQSCCFYSVRREAEALLEQAEALIVLADQQAFPLYTAIGTVARGCALVEQGQFAQGIAELQWGLDALKTEGVELFVPYCVAILARAHQRAGRYHHGINLLSEALARVRTCEQRWCEAELYRFQGELLLALPQPDGINAEACFHKAIAVAREQGARMWELRAVMSLTRLWRDQGRRIEAHYG